jgi:2-polyprenyl-3-methyl-5-hydroxy-6-metoxy-1,4-benzoquinol methylase
LRSLYAEPHDHKQFADHVGRVDATIALAREMGPMASVADLSCGNGAIANSLDAEEVTLGDFAPGYDICGPIEQTIHQLQSVDLFICSETIEHLDDPDAVLAAIRSKCKHLVLSTPLTRSDQVDLNTEHYWAFDKEDIEVMLSAAGFTPTHYAEFDGGYYLWQIWGCS